MKQTPHLDLAREDLMETEGALCAQLASLFSFSGHALYFPTGPAPQEPQLLPRERRLLLPLRRGERLLGVCMLHGVRAREVRPLLPYLPAVTALCLDNLARAKALRTDAVTGLATESALFARMEDAAHRVRAHLEEPAAADGGPLPLHRLCMGLVLLRLGNGQALLRQGGHAFAERCLRALAESCRAALPSDVLAARVGRWDFALLLSASGRGACHNLAAAALARMEAVRLCPPLLQKPVRLRLYAGHALYPQDMQGAELKLEMFEQARLCMDRARLAADVAGHGFGAGLEGRIVPFARILQEGGFVLETLPLGRVRLSLGRQAKAREGMRFAVRGRREGGAPRCKGEIVLLGVRDTDSVAEILHLTDATCQPEPGDSLTLLGQAPVLSPDLGAQDFWAGQTPQGRAQGGLAANAADSCQSLESQEPATVSAEAASEDAAPPSALNVCAGSGQALAGLPVSFAADPGVEGLCGHGDFLNRFAREAEGCARFALALMRLEPVSTDMAHEGGERAQALNTALALWRTAMARTQEGQAPPLAGCYGSDSLIFLHPGLAAQALAPVYEQVCADLRGRGLPAAAGLAGYPFLQYRKAEMPDCALKALEYALLLPEPHVGLCNSLALNISADRRYSLGDIFGAVEEYKRALLADEGNAMAWNSLGVCMAALGRQHEAHRHFLEALRHKPEESVAQQIYYNLGAVCQGLDERRAAARYYRQCVQLAPQHLFAHIRLGQLCEQGGRRAEARRFYEKAAAIEDARPGTPSVARRHLARVAVRQRKGGEARELLHEALVRNPQDAASMLLLAGIYLDSNEDPAMAELLARKSVGLHDRPEAWHTLARALRALEREEEARLAEARAVLA